MNGSLSYHHPPLVLGNIVNTQILDLMNQMDRQNNLIQAAQDKMNSYIMMKRSIAMTVNELIDMNVDINEVKTKLTEVDGLITNSAAEYMRIRLQSEEKLQQLGEKLSLLDTGSTPESPVNFSQSEIKNPPLASDSLKLDSQYFSFESDLEDDKLAIIEKYIKETTGDLGNTSSHIAKSAASQIKRQRKNHNLAGTIIIIANCTHKNVSIIDPLVLDIDKAIPLWNSIHSSAIIDTARPDSVEQLLKKGTNNTDSLTILTGAAYGSCFIGMVHMIKSENTVIGDVDEIASQLQEQMRIGGWLENSSGGFGVETSIIEDIKKRLSTQRISSHITLLSLGALPSIASNRLESCVNKIVQTGPEGSFDAEEPDIKKTLNSGADEAISVKRKVAIENAKIQAVMKSLDIIDQNSNKVLDINSLMSAFENYVSTINKEDNKGGIPISFQVKKISQGDLAKLWLQKYYPNRLNSRDTQ